ncbi:MAG: FAD-dependent oxidoreductase [Candidatus Moduliflexus flocculans]|nr:FAD-dependent oxidoreductase [Candidatus Moduliflexus flocculans]
MGLARTQTTASSQALDDVAEIHPQVTKEFEVGASWMWHDDEFAGGALALFDPGQQSLLHDEIVKPEGRIHFAGEHASALSCLDPGRNRVWVCGAAIAIHQAP